MSVKSTVASKPIGFRNVPGAGEKLLDRIDESIEVAQPGM